MKILLIEDDSDIREMIQFFLETDFNADVVIANSGQEAIAKIESTKGLDAIICDYEMPNGNGGLVYLHLLNNALNIPYILCSSYHPDHYPEFKNPVRLAGYAIKPDVIYPLMQVISEIFPEPTKRAQEDKKDYYPIKLKALFNSNTSHYNLYIKLGPAKFIKVINKGDPIELSDLDRFNSKNLESLFVHHSDLKSIEVEFTERIKTLLKAKSIDPGITFELTASTLELIHSIGSALDIDEKTKALAKSTVDAVFQTISAHPKLSDRLRSIAINPNNYLYAHSVALAHILTSFGAGLGFINPEDEALSKSLITAALLHDLSFTNPELARVQDIAELGLSGHDLSDQMVKEINGHPLESAKLVKELFEGGSEVAEKLILKHHEKPDSSGFPNQLGLESFDHLSALFVISHDLVAHALEHDGKIQVSNFLIDLSPSYPPGVFQEVIKKITAAWAKAKI